MSDNNVINHLKEAQSNWYDNLRNLQCIDTNKSSEAQKIYTDAAFKKLAEVEGSFDQWARSGKKLVAATTAYATPLIGAGYLVSQCYSDLPSLFGTLLSYGGFAALGTGATNFAFNKVTGINPLKMVGTAALLGFLYVAKLPGDAVRAHYNRQADEAAARSKDLQIGAKESQIKAFANLTEGLRTEWVNVRNDPNKQENLKIHVEILAKRMSFIERSFANNGFTPSDIADILNPLKELIEDISSEALVFRVENSAEAHKYNAELLALAGDGDLDFVPYGVSALISQAKSLDIGSFYSIKKYGLAATTALTVAAGAAIATAGAMALGAYSYAPEIFASLSGGTIDPATLGLAIGGVSLTAIGAGGYAFSRVNHSYDQTRADRESEALHKITTAEKELVQVYRGIADHMEANIMSDAQTDVIMARVAMLEEKIETMEISNATKAELQKQVDRIKGWAEMPAQKRIQSLVMKLPPPPIKQKKKHKTCETVVSDGDTKIKTCTTTKYPELAAGAAAVKARLQAAAIASAVTMPQAAALA